MKKIIKRVLQVIGVIVVLLILTAAGFFLKFKSEVKNMDPVPTVNVIANVFSIKDSFVNMFLVKDSNRFIAIDAGNSAENVSGELKKLHINPDQVFAVLLTHTDKDHVGALSLFKNAKVYMSRMEEQMINGQKSKFFIFGNHIAAKDYTLLEDQQNVVLGNTKIRCILTEGHTSGSMCYLIDEKYLFTGDAVGLKSGKIVAFNKFFNMDSKAARLSVKKITNLPGAEFLFTAHYGFTANYQDAVRDWK